MKILLYEWGAYLQRDIEELLKESGISFRSFRHEFSDRDAVKDERLERWLSSNVSLNEFDAILSVNYWPVLSGIAQEAGIKYIAWCYDNPFDLTNAGETLGNECNYVFLFDRIQTEGYKKQGFKTVYHLPLGVNEKRLGALKVTDADRKSFSADVSLVGSLYESQIDPIMGVMDEYSKGFVNAVMDSQKKIYGGYIIDDVITAEFVDKINKGIKKDHPESDFRLPREALTWAMASQVTRWDRLTLLAILGRRFDVSLYSFHECNVLKDVRCHKAVDYLTEMPKVFMCSGINLNPILRCIQSGIPLRAFDIMGTGGLLLSSYQPELDELFVNEGEMVMYYSIEDAVAKAEFLLKNEDFREKVAKSGQQKVLTEYTLRSRFEQICKVAGL